MTTGVPAPIISLASRLLFLSQWSRETGLDLVVAQAAASKEASLRACRPEAAGFAVDPLGQAAEGPEALLGRA